MPRPKLTTRKKRSYNLLLFQEDYDKIYSLSVQRTRESGQHVTKAQIIREAISRFLREIVKRENGCQKSHTREGL